MADNNDSSDNFTADIQAVQSLLPTTLTTTVLEADTDPTIDSDLLSALNSGQALVNYEGHGSEEIWANGLLNDSDVEGLTNGAMTPVVIAMTCLNGYFQDVYADSLAKALLKVSGGGAVAVWASSGLTMEPQAAMDQADGLAQALGPLQVGFNLHFKLVNHRETALDFGDDAGLFGQGWKRNGYRPQLRLRDFVDPCRGFYALLYLPTENRAWPDSRNPIRLSELRGKAYSNHRVRENNLARRILGTRPSSDKFKTSIPTRNEEIPFTNPQVICQILRLGWQISDVIV